VQNTPSHYGWRTRAVWCSLRSARSSLG
jgi:hypothetical protein